MGERALIAQNRRPTEKAGRRPEARHVPAVVLYAVTVTTGGSVWLATKFQLGIVPPATSLAYRFAIASALLFLWAKLRGIPLPLGLKAHGFMALLGVLMFSINFLLLYLAIEHLTTGLVAVIFSTSVFMNLVNAAVFLHRPIERRVMLGTIPGLVGMLVVFGPELRAVDPNGSTGLVGAPLRLRICRARVAAERR